MASHRQAVQLRFLILLVSAAGHEEDPSKALEAARRQIAALQARLRAEKATNAALELQLADGQSDLGAQRKLQQELQERLAQMQAQLAEQAGWQVLPNFHPSESLACNLVSSALTK